MENVTLSVDFRQPNGKIKPMHATNNGPVYKFTEDQRVTNLDAFREAKIPFYRLHDSSFYATYGGEHSVDIQAVFPDFDADERDPASYDFTLTDEYMKVLIFAGGEPFYRLGSKIEHWPKKYGTLPPKDFAKWARICEHIIRHYTEGWADGFTYSVRYWEIWNEPDGAADDADPVDKKCWGGTLAQFCEFYEIAAKHLKACFPHLKIGGPAVCTSAKPWVESFLSYLEKTHTPLDFFSWHCYTGAPERISALSVYTRRLLDRHGFFETESILDEWNYVSDWVGQAWIDSLKTEVNHKGASFIAATMLASQADPVDMLMYYDARPGAMNGLFDTDVVSVLRPGYYPFRMFARLWSLGRSVPVVSSEKRDIPADVDSMEQIAGLEFAHFDGGVYAAAAVSPDHSSASVMLTHYRDVESCEPVRVRLSLAGIPVGERAKLTVRLFDEKHPDVVIAERNFASDTAALEFDLPLFSVMQIGIDPLTRLV